MALSAVDSSFPKFKWGDFEEGDVVEREPTTPTPPASVRQQRDEEQDQGVCDDDSIDIGVTAKMLMGKGSAGSGKERFRHRLWCYLFENLNRAIDELYFMCELECDMEQIQEALLVLNEADLDFTDLKSRIEGFDKLKQTGAASAATNMGSAETSKLDHQRPHAIAWEVRRMASSPRRADILSLSLDAFKKVQHGNESKHQKRRDTMRILSFEQQDSLPIIPTAVSTSDDDGRQPKASQDAAGPPYPPYGGTVVVQAKAVADATCSKFEADGTGSEDHRKQGDKSALVLEAWKEKRNWEDILSSPLKNVSKTCPSPAVARKSTERGRVLHDKLMSPERKKKSPMEMKKEVDEKQARATRIRRELENERALRLQRTTEKLNRVSEWQAVRSNKLREGMHARQQRGESRHEAHLAQIARRASDESSKVSEVRFITSLNEENKKLSLQQKLQDSEVRRAERLQSLRIKQREDMAREEAAMERRKLLEAERLQRIAETQRKKEEAQARREEERKAASAAREARAVEQVRKKEVRAKAQEEEVELLRHKLAERLRESALRRKVYLEQIRERAVMEPREQGSPLSRRPSSRDGQPRGTNTASQEIEIASERELSSAGKLVTSLKVTTDVGAGQHQALKKRIKKIRQRLTNRRYEFVEPAGECVVPVTRSKVARWVQDLQRCQQARKAGASAMSLILAEMIKFFEGKDMELHAARHAGLLDFIPLALATPHSSKPEASQSTIPLLRVLLLLLGQPSNRGYFLAKNLLSPLIPMLSVALENYSSVGCSSGVTGGIGIGIGDEKFDAAGEVLEDLMKCAVLVMGQSPSDERQLQMLDDLVELIVAFEIVHRLRNLFALFDRPQAEGAPFPPPVLLGLKLLETLTRGRMLNGVHFASAGTRKWVEVADKHSLCSTGTEEGLSSTGGTTFEEAGAGQSEEHDDVAVSRQTPYVCSKDDMRKQMFVGRSGGFLLVSIAETRLVGLPSLLTAVLLQVNPRFSPEQVASSLPSNFEEVATSVLRVLNNTACMDLSLVQTMLAMPDLKMEFFHLVSFLLSYCTCKWRSASDQVAFLLLETLLLLGYFALLHPGNQAVLRWGKSPTILHKICDLPFGFFSDSELTPILVGTLLPACYGCERNRDVIQQELSMEMLLSVFESPGGKVLPKHRMDVIAEEPEEDIQRSAAASSGSDARLVEAEAAENPRSVSGPTTFVKKQQQHSKSRKLRTENERQHHAVFLLENRFPPSLWDSAKDFFSLREHVCSS